MSSVRDRFVEEFGEAEAAKVERAAEEHANEINSANRGSDPFKWALIICIGYECLSHDRYRKAHEIEAPWPEVHQWIKDHADLGSHDGDFDYLGAVAGAYDEYVLEGEE